METLRERLLDTISRNGIDRATILSHQQLCSEIDSLSLLEVIEVLEEWLNRSIPENELTEHNFNSISGILSLADRLASEESHTYGAEAVRGESNEYRAS